MDFVLLKFKLMRFMQGRNGIDQYSQFLNAVVLIMFLILGIIELIFNYKGNNRFLNKISIFLDVISIFVLLFTKQPYVIALMFIIFIIKIIMLANVNKSVVKNNKCER